MKATLLKLGILVSLLAVSPAFAGAAFYASGLLRYYSNDDASFGGEPSAAFARFIQDHFWDYGVDFEWRPDRRFRDKTHIHQSYRLYYRGRRVVGRELKLHYNLSKRGLEYATSGWERPFEVKFPPETDRNRRLLLEKLKAPRVAEIGFFDGRIDAEPVIWIDPRTLEPAAAFDVRANGNKPGAIRRFLADEWTGRVLEEKFVTRNVDVDTLAWKISPKNGNTNDKPLDSVKAKDLTDATKLASDFLQVRRQADVDKLLVVDIDPDPDKPTAGDLGSLYSDDPEQFTFDCKAAGADQCPNQRIDGVNVYYHTETYRSALQSYFNDLGVSPAPTDGREPLEVFVNAFGFNTDDDGDVTNETNNAGYFPDGCGSVGTTAIDRCLIFMPPAKLKGSSICDSDPAIFYDLAREALVVVHEYQHFVTDSIVYLEPGGFDPETGAFLRNVGDALHEAYSDYFAASQVSDLNGTDVTVVGEYGFQNCTFYARDVAVLRPFENTAADKDAHVAGLSFASGLWQLRQELGKDIVDLIALKSLFFLSTRPGFAESIEALIRADKALNEGDNVPRIRQLFYEEIKWAGGQAGIFRDVASGVAEVGFRSCNSAHGASGTKASLATVLAWLVMVVGAGRWLRRPR